MTEKRRFAELTPRRARIGGAVLILCALVLAGIGLFLAAFTLDLPYAATGVWAVLDLGGWMTRLDF